MKTTISNMLTAASESGHGIASLQALLKKFPQMDVEINLPTVAETQFRDMGSFPGPEYSDIYLDSAEKTAKMRNGEQIGGSIPGRKLE